MNTQLLIETLEDHNHKVRLVEGDTEIVIACPLCFAEKQKLYISAATGLWICYLCDERGHLRNLFTRVCNLSYQEAAILEQEIRGGEEKKPTMVVSRPPPPSSVELPPGFQLDAGDGLAEEYFESRGIHPIWVKEIKAGYCLVGKYHHRVIIPVYTRGLLCTFVARTWVPDEKKKVLMPEGSQAERALFGCDYGYDLRLVMKRENNPPLVLVEGVFDAIRMWDIGYVDTMATLGAHVTDLQRALVKQLKPESVVLLRDGDDAGRAAAIKEGRELAYDMLNVSIASLPEGTDPCSADPEDIRRALDEARPVVLDYGIESQKEVHQ